MTSNANFGFAPQARGPGPTTTGGPGQEPGSNANFGYLDRIADQKKLEEAEEVDFSADIHGGWTLENSKSRLHQYLQSTRQQSQCDYKYTSVGPDHNRFG